MYNNNWWPTNFSGNFVAGANDHASYYTDGQLLAGLGGCRDTGTSSKAIAEAEGAEIPRWALLAGLVIAALLLLKKR